MSRSTSSARTLRNFFRWMAIPASTAWQYRIVSPWRTNHLPVSVAGPCRSTPLSVDRARGSTVEARTSDGQRWQDSTQTAIDPSMTARFGSFCDYLKKAASYSAGSARFWRPVSADLEATALFRTCPKIFYAAYAEQQGSPLVVCELGPPR